jgi:hypothetical protein
VGEVSISTRTTPGMVPRLKSHHRPRPSESLSPPCSPPPLSLMHSPPQSAQVKQLQVQLESSWAAVGRAWTQQLSAGQQEAAAAVGALEGAAEQLQATLEGRAAELEACAAELERERAVSGGGGRVEGGSARQPPEGERPVLPALRCAAKLLWVDLGCCR